MGNPLVGPPGGPAPPPGAPGPRPNGHGGPAGAAPPPAPAQPATQPPQSPPQQQLPAQPAQPYGHQPQLPPHAPPPNSAQRPPGANGPGGPAPAGPPPAGRPAAPPPSGPPPKDPKGPGGKGSGSSGQPQQKKAQPPRIRVRARRRAVGASFGAMPVANVVLIEIGLALGFLLVLISPALWPVAATVAGVLLLWAIARYRGRWLTHWMGLVLSYRGRNHVRFSEPPQSGAGQPEGANLQTSAGSRRDDRSRDDEESASDADERNGNQRDSGDDEKSLRFIGPENHRVSLLRLTVPDLVVGSRQDHNRNQVGIAWHDGKWTAVLAVEPTPGLISEMNRTPNLPLGALAPCLEDRGVVLDSIQVLWHCYPGSAALPVESPALNSYLEVLGPLPAAARRTTWVVVRIDPRYCAKAVGERGGGIVGAHRALIGALSRVRSALERQGIVTRPLDPEGLLQAGVSSAELHGVLGSNEPVGLQERWNSVTMGYIGHSSYAITSWPSHMTHTLNALTGVRALSSSIALTISPVGEEKEVGLRGLVRVSARTPSELSAADTRMRRISSRLGLTLTPLGGLQLEGFTSTLPIGGAA